MTGPTRRLRVVIADDDPIVRAGLTAMLRTEPGIEVVGEAADGAGTFAQVEATGPDIVLVDVHMPTTDGLWALNAIRRRHPDLPVLMTSTVFSDDAVRRAPAAGATGCVFKHDDAARLIGAVRAGAHGTIQLSAGAFAQVRDRLTTRDDDALTRIDTLTDRDRTVALAVTRGLTNADIAAELYLSVATVKATVARLLDEFGVDNRVQLAIRVHDAGLA